MNVVPKNTESKSTITKEFVSECKTALINKKEEIFEQMHVIRAGFQNGERSGDEVDQTVAVLAQKQMMGSLERLGQQLVEIEHALARIERGQFGVCEETEEFIEVDRLKALPWTRLSIEGAEIREALTKRYAK